MNKTEILIIAFSFVVAIWIKRNPVLIIAVLFFIAAFTTSPNNDNK
jgi:hypothetical protein